MKSGFVSITVSWSLLVVSSCVPIDEPTDSCLEPLVVNDDAVSVEQPTTTNPAIDESCGEGGAAVFYFTAQTSGSYRFITSESLCGFRSAFRGLRVANGEALLFAIKSISAPQVRIVIDMLDPIARGEPCTPTLKECIDSDCVVHNPEPLCEVIDPRGTCDIPLPVAIDEARIVRADTRQQTSSPCISSSRVGHPSCRPRRHRAPIAAAARWSTAAACAAR